MKTYIAHYTKLENRKKNLEQLLTAADYKNFHFVTDEPPKHFVDMFYSSSPKLWKERIAGLNYGSKVNYRGLSRAEISLLYKHYLMFERIACGNDSYALILEDDVIFGENFKEELKNSIEQTPPDWDFIFIGSGCNLRIPPRQLQPNKVSYLKKHPAGKCTDSFLVKQAAAVRVLSTLLPFVLPIDFELNYHMMKHDMKTYWIEPPFVCQGSQNGQYTSEIN